MRNRSVVEIMVLCFTLIVTVTILGLASAIVIIEINNPEANTQVIATTLMGLISGILGALLGLLAGRNEKMGNLYEKPDDNA